MLTTSRFLRMVSFVLGLLLIISAAVADTTKQIVLENASFRYVIGADARNVAFLDRATGSNYLRSGDAAPCALIQTGGKSQPATVATFSRGRLTLRFGDSGVKAVLKTESRPSHVTFSHHIGIEQQFQHQVPVVES